MTFRLPGTILPSEGELSIQLKEGPFLQALLLIPGLGPGSDQHTGKEDHSECSQVLKRGIGSFDEHDRLLVSREPALRRHKNERLWPLSIVL